VLALVVLRWGRLPEPTRCLGWLLQLGLWLPLVHREQAVITLQAQQHLRRAYAWLQSQGLRRIWVEPQAYAIPCPW
jgi:hypothetical protein